uniref:SREBP regulating gene protein n=1 Tax=Fibrocapsa japonica TaxID=94617 RepID=A0A7S2UWJ7_9STRA|mmetsp:Transcript_17126/g.25025  ORF Transcript_17126/g.25025 Transcript_17126/m.25025 type:complete len:214 (+) Transcript_17126:25-666(+)
MKFCFAAGLALITHSIVHSALAFTLIQPPHQKYGLNTGKSTRHALNPTAWNNLAVFEASRVSLAHSTKIQAEDQGPERNDPLPTFTTKDSQDSMTGSNFPSTLSSNGLLGRRAAVATALAASLGVILPPAFSPADAADERLWLSGKGDKPKDSKDTKGTKKDINFLRCLSNCLAVCQKPTSGVQRDRSECLEDCRDECCQTYEQCTYTIKGQD